MPAEPADSLHHCSAIKCQVFLPAHSILSVHFSTVETSGAVILPGESDVAVRGRGQHGSALTLAD